jgi:hypothetical protein
MRLVDTVGKDNVPIHKERRDKYVWFVAMVNKDGVQRYTAFVDEMTPIP